MSGFLLILVSVKVKHAGVLLVDCIVLASSLTVAVAACLAFWFETNQLDCLPICLLACF